MTRIMLFITTIFLAGCQGPVYYVSPQTASMASQYNKGYQDGLQEGETIGQEKGYRLGYQEGYGKALYLGKLLGVDSILQEMKEVDWDKYAIMITQDYNCYNAHLEEFEDGYRTGYTKGSHEGQLNAYEEGFKEGYQQAFDLTNSINLAKGESVRYPSGQNSRLAIDYDRVVRALHDINTETSYAEFARFSGALREVHTEILGYLVRRLSNDLSPVEQSEVYQRYEEIHNKLAERYYRRYISLCNTRNRNYEQRSFFDYRHYNSSDIFLDVVGMGIVGVADVVFTYAKSNPQFCATVGFETMGHLAELIIDEVLLPVYDLLMKQSLQLDYDAKVPLLEQSARAVILPQIALTRTHTKQVTHTFSGPGYSTRVKMEIVTIVALGFDVDHLILEVNHQRQAFNVHMTNVPRFMHTVYQGYQVLETTNQVGIGYPGGQLRFKISARELEQVFDQHKEDPPSLDICQKPLSMNDLETVIPALTKVLEPAIALPVGCYQANVNFEGHSEKSIITARCR